MRVLVDGDIVCYRCAVSVKDDEPVELVINRIDNLMTQIIDDTEASEFEFYIKGEKNFRYYINPDYKANRIQPKPFHLESAYQYVLDCWNAIPSGIYESDDLLGIQQRSDTIIASIDKDLLMIPGMHWNFVKLEKQRVSYMDGIRKFWKQMMIGDTSDNIYGIQGIGPKKAEKLIDWLDSEQEMFEVVYEKYNDPKRFVMNANCLWILQHEEGMWANQQVLTLPKLCQQEVEASLEFMKSLNLITSTGHGMMTSVMSGIPVNGDGMDAMQKKQAAWTSSINNPQPDQEQHD
jgi:5'-3' exonuclease